MHLSHLESVSVHRILFLGVFPPNRNSLWGHPIRTTVTFLDLSGEFLCTLGIQSFPRIKLRSPPEPILALAVSVGPPALPSCHTLIPNLANKKNSHCHWEKTNAKSRKQHQTTLEINGNGNGFAFLHFVQYRNCMYYMDLHIAPSHFQGCVMFFVCCQKSTGSEIDCMIPDPTLVCGVSFHQGSVPQLLQMLLVGGCRWPSRRGWWGERSCSGHRERLGVEK